MNFLMVRMWESKSIRMSIMLLATLAKRVEKAPSTAHSTWFFFYFTLPGCGCFEWWWRRCRWWGNESGTSYSFNHRLWIWGRWSVWYRWTRILWWKNETELEKSMDNLSIIDNGITGHSNSLEYKTNDMSVTGCETPTHIPRTVSKTSEQMSVDEENEMLISVDENEMPEYSSEPIKNSLSSLGFSKFTNPPLLYRHPPPAIGSDDDVSKIRKIDYDVLMKKGYSGDENKLVHRNLCDPDNKIGKCVLSLIEINMLYKVCCLLPEFPLLHLRKSKINVLFAAYKDARIVQILRYMRDEKKDDWMTLVSI